MLRLIKVILFLAAVAGLAVVGYGFVGDLSPEQEEINAPVTLDGDG